VEVLIDLMRPGGQLSEEVPVVLLGRGSGGGHPAACTTTGSGRRTLRRTTTGFAPRQDKVEAAPTPPLPRREEDEVAPGQEEDEAAPGREVVEAAPRLEEDEVASEVEARRGRIRRRYSSPRHCSSPQGEGRTEGGGGRRHRAGGRE
jgi:hypothetical protein